MPQIRGYEGHSLLTQRELGAILQSIPPAGRFLEVGTFCGASLAWWADRRPGATFWAIDDFSYWPRAICPDLPRNSWFANQRPNMHVLVGRTPDFAGLFRDGQFDVIFVDACHDEAPVTLDLVSALPWLKPGGALLCHDYVGNFGVTPAVNKWCDQAGWAVARIVDTLAFLQEVAR